MKFSLSHLTAAAACLASTASAIGPSVPLVPPKRPDGKTLPTENWRWSDPFAAKQITKFTPTCTAQQTFQAHEFLLDDLSIKAPMGIFPYRDALKKVFADRPAYPGSWDGTDPHGYDRNILLMNYTDVPVPVREWIEDQEREGAGGNYGAGRGLFGVFRRAEGDRIKILDRVPVAPSPRPIPRGERQEDETRVVLFAPGALYEILPLWVAEGSACEDNLLDLSKYSSKLADGAVVAWPVEKTSAARKEHKRNMEFTIKAEVLKLNKGETIEEEAEAPKEEPAKEAKEAKEPVASGKEEL